MVYKNGYGATGDETKYVYGILAYSGSNCSRNTVYDNGENAATKVIGIKAMYGVSVVGNTVYYNGKNATNALASVVGINLTAPNLVDQNTAYYNGQGAAGAHVDMNLSVSGVVYGNNYPQ